MLQKSFAIVSAFFITLGEHIPTYFAVSSIKDLEINYEKVASQNFLFFLRDTERKIEERLDPLSDSINPHCLVVKVRPESEGNEPVLSQENSSERIILFNVSKNGLNSPGRFY